MCVGGFYVFLGVRLLWWIEIVDDGYIVIVYDCDFVVGASSGNGRSVVISIRGQLCSVVSNFR